MGFKLNCFKRKYSKKNPEDGFSRISYSQEGEDMLLSQILEDKSDGLYIDIGAHHPFRFSNTYYFYKKGWKGINIEPNPGLKKKFDEHRSRDINIEVGISNIEGFFTYYQFNETALNTFDQTEAESKNGIHNGTYYITDQIQIQTKKLSTVLKELLIDKTNIDFLNIDVEGLDYDVLQSNDWELFRPKVILIEELNFDFTDLNKNNVYKFLINKGYKLMHRTINTSFYVLK
jgi:FkbM family methyltransferase